jgi:hypothetical protein
VSGKPKSLNVTATLPPGFYAFVTKGEAVSSIAQYRICPRCARAVPIDAKEHYCINDGTLMLEKCPKCQTKICSPYTRHCAECGFAFENLATSKMADFTEPSPVQGKTRFAGWRFVLLTGIVGALLVTAWFAQPRQELKMVFVGKILESRAFIAIAFQQNRVLAYVCDGQRIAEWFKGSVTDQHTFKLQSKNGAVLVATLDAQSARGSIELRNGHFTFAAIPARDQAALYRAERQDGQKAVVGWIVLPNGEQRSALVNQTGVHTAPPLESTNETPLGLAPKIVNPHDPNGFEF